MTYRYYDDTPSRGSRVQDPSIDAWFRELRGDAPPPPEPRSAAAASRRRQLELDTEAGAWVHRGGNAGPQMAPPVESWSVDTRAWTPDWDSGATTFMPRTNGRGGGHHRHAARDRRSTGEHPRVPERRQAPPGVPDGRRSTGEQPRIAERRPQPRAIEARAIEAPPAEQRAEVRDLNEAREARAARVAGMHKAVPSPSVPSPSGPVYEHEPRGGGYSHGFDPYHDSSAGADYNVIPAPLPAQPAAHAAPAPSLPAPPLPSPPPAPVTDAPAAYASPSPAPAHIPGPAPAPFESGPLGPPPFGNSPATTLAGRPYVSATPFTDGALATAPAPVEAQHEPPAYDSRLPEPRQSDSQFDVVLPDQAGDPALAFKNGQWFKLGAGGITSSPITVRSAVLDHSNLAGSVVQILCWWMRENSRRERALDIATELALAVTELTHMADLRQKTPAFY
jgi:hypothetical protein